MIEIFALVLNMSIAASCAVILVLVFRLFLKRVPKIFSYLLWLAVLIRFLVPVTLETSFGIIPALSVVHVRESHSYSMHNYTPYEKENNGEQDGSLEQDSLAEQSGLLGQDNLSKEALDSEKIEYLPNEEIKETEYVYDMENAFSMEISVWGINIEVPARIMRILAFVWCIVGISLMIYQVISYGLFMGRIHRQSGNGNKETGKGRGLYTWSSDAVKTPFVGGIFCPVVYLPDDLGETQRKLILEHEKIHIKRLDYLVKPVAMFICCIYWFNPFAWLAFYLMERDMEGSCDEAVLRKIGYDRKKEYANTLLGIAERDGWKPGHPIAFGENNVKNRIKRTVKLKKAKLGTIVTGVIVTFLAMILLLVNRSNLQDSQEAAEVIVLHNEAMKEGVPGIDSNTATEFVEPQEVAYVTTNGAMQDTNYVPSGDYFENILLTVDAPVDLVEILYAYPVDSTTISDAYGARIHPVTQEEKFHSGIDFVADTGSAVMAAADGTVVKTGYDDDCGNYIILQHINGDMTYYAQCETIMASEGDTVQRGEQIATVGSTGKSTGPHLHFAVSRNGSYVEPKFVESKE